MGEVRESELVSIDELLVSPPMDLDIARNPDVLVRYVSIDNRGMCLFDLDLVQPNKDFCLIAKVVIPPKKVVYSNIRLREAIRYILDCGEEVEFFVI